MHGTTTSTFAFTEVRAACEPTEPPPLLKRWSASLVHRARAPDQRFRVPLRWRRWGLSGLFIGTYSAVPYAALCRVAQPVRHVRCPFAVESPVELVMHRAAEGMPLAVALINRARPERCDLDFGRCDRRQVGRQGGDLYAHVVDFSFWPG